MTMFGCGTRYSFCSHKIQIRNFITFYQHSINHLHENGDPKKYYVASKKYIKHFFRINSRIKNVFRSEKITKCFILTPSFMK